MSARAAIATALAVSSAACIGCSGAEDESASQPAATVERDSGGQAVVLSANAARRLGIRTAPVRRVGVREVVPYTAIVYRANGSAFAYTNPARLTYRQAVVRIARIRGNRVLLDRGPQPGSRVVTVGADELLGAEEGVGAER
jgi:hypothetical protein